MFNNKTLNRRIKVKGAYIIYHFMLLNKLMGAKMTCHDASMPHDAPSRPGVAHPGPVTQTHLVGQLRARRGGWERSGGPSGAR